MHHASYGLCASALVDGGAYAHAPSAAACAAMVASFEGQHEVDGALRTVGVGDVTMAFLKRGALLYVCSYPTAKTTNTAAMRNMAMAHAYVVSQLTNQFEAVAKRKPGFDVARLLEGPVAPSVDGLWRALWKDPTWQTGAYAVAPVPSVFVRRRLLASLSGANSDAAAARLLANTPPAPAEDEASAMAQLRAAMLEAAESPEKDNAALVLGLLVDARTGGVLALAQNPRLCQRGKKLGWHSDDIRLVCHHVAGMRWRVDGETGDVRNEAPTEFRDPLRDHLMPICLPHTLGPNAYAHALVAFLPAPDAPANLQPPAGAVLVLVSTDASAFPVLRRRRLFVHAALHASAPDDGPSAFAQLYGRPNGSLPNPPLAEGVGVRLAMYVRPGLEQGFVVRPHDQTLDESGVQMVADACTTARCLMHDPRERGAWAPADVLRRDDPLPLPANGAADIGDAAACRVVWRADADASALACVGDGFEAVLVLRASVEQAAAVAVCNRFVAWAKAEERRLLLAPSALTDPSFRLADAASALPDPGTLAPNGAAVWD